MQSRATCVICPPSQGHQTERRSRQGRVLSTKNKQLYHLVDDEGIAIRPAKYEVAQLVWQFSKSNLLRLLLLL